jgi:hypothetical protein
MCVQGPADTGHGEVQYCTVLPNRYGQKGMFTPASRATRWECNSVTNTPMWAPGLCSHRITRRVKAVDVTRHVTTLEEGYSHQTAG